MCQVTVNKHFIRHWCYHAFLYFFIFWAVKCDFLRHLLMFVLNCVYLQYSVLWQNVSSDFLSVPGLLYPCNQSFQSCIGTNLVVDWSVGLLVGRSVGRMVGRMVSQLVGRSHGLTPFCVCGGCNHNSVLDLVCFRIYIQKNISILIFLLKKRLEVRKDWKLWIFITEY